MNDTGNNSFPAKDSLNRSMVPTVTTTTATTSSSSSMTGVTTTNTATAAGVNGETDAASMVSNFGGNGAMNVNDSTQQQGQLPRNRRKYKNGGSQEEDDNDNDNDNDMDRMMPPPPRPAAVAGPLKSIEGWVVFVTGIHEEAQEDDLSDIFSEYGKVKSIHLNMDRKTGYVKGYALIEYDQQIEAQDAINSMHGTKFLGRRLGVHWAFCKSPTATYSSRSIVDTSSSSGGSGGGGGGGGDNIEGGGRGGGTGNGSVGNSTISAVEAGRRRRRHTGPRYES